MSFYLRLDFKHCQIDKPSAFVFGDATGFHPDPLNCRWRDYGLRMGLRGMIDSLGRHSMQAGALVHTGIARR